MNYTLNLKYVFVHETMPIIVKNDLSKNQTFP